MTSTETTYLVTTIGTIDEGETVVVKEEIPLDCLGSYLQQFLSITFLSVDQILIERIDHGT